MGKKKGYSLELPIPLNTQLSIKQLFEFYFKKFAIADGHPLQLGGKFNETCYLLNLLQIVIPIYRGNFSIRQNNRFCGRFFQPITI